MDLVTVPDTSPGCAVATSLFRDLQRAESAAPDRHCQDARFPESSLHPESKHQPLVSRRAFAKRVAVSFAAASVLILVSLLAGLVGYHWLEGLPWIDAFVNASMILSGMGPLDPPKTWGGKLFAGLYALYSGLALLVAAGILFAPFVHRLLHRFHVEAGEGA